MQKLLNSNCGRQCLPHLVFLGLVSVDSIYLPDWHRK